MSLEIPANGCLYTFLTVANNYVSINSSSSMVLPVISGVPQGSILGLLMFLIYVNDLPEVILSTKVLLFTDNVKCYCSIHSVNNFMCMQDDLTRLAQWSATWNLPFNVEKYSILSVQSRHRHSQFAFSCHINDTLLARKTALTDLGVMLTADLSWRDHYYCKVLRSVRFTKKSLFVCSLPAG